MQAQVHAGAHALRGCAVGPPGAPEHGRGRDTARERRRARVARERDGRGAFARVFDRVFYYGI